MDDCDSQGASNHDQEQAEGEAAEIEDDIHHKVIAAAIEDDDDDSANAAIDYVDYVTNVNNNSDEQGNNEEEDEAAEEENRFQKPQSEIKMIGFPHQDSNASAADIYSGH